jgi:glycosyltransferase involved in cell wall biosynthesis
MMKHAPKLVTVDHNLWSSYGRVTRLANHLTVALDDQHVAVSEEVRNSMSERARRATQVIVHGIPLAAVTARRDERAAQRLKLGLGDGDIAVTTVANLRRTKDYPTLLRAAVDVLAAHPDVVFLAAGQGPLEEEIRAEIETLGLGDRFRLLGYVDDAVGLLSASDVFVLGSQVEGLSIALLEAMAMGLPVVATAVGGTPEVVTDGVEGRLVPARDPSALAAAIIEVVDDPAGRSRMGAAAAARASRYDISAAAREFESLYARLVP